jgi:DNA-binding NtrC family response regulator
MRGKVLIVDDYPDWRELLGGLLEREGHRVTTVGDLEAARAFIDDNRDLDLAVLDIRLVDTDEDNQQGMLLLADISRCRVFARVILVTGYGTMKMQRKAFKAYRAFDFFSKAEFDSDDFRQTCRQAIESAVRDRQAWKDRQYARSHRYDAWQRRRR